MKINKDNLLSISSYLGLISVACLPVKLSFAYIFLYSSFLLLLLSGSGKLLIKQLTEAKSIFGLVALWIYALILAPWSIDITNSVQAVIRNLGLTIVAYLVLINLFAYFSAKICLLTLIFSQTALSIYSLLESAFPNLIKTAPIGAVTESGQLTLVIMLCFFVLQNVLKNNQFQISSNFNNQKFNLSLLFAFALFLAALLFAFNFEYYFVILTFVICSAWLWRNYSKKTSPTWLQVQLLICFATPLLLAALVANLKRGPWLGIFIGGMIYLAFYSKKFAALVLGLILCLFVFFQPIQSRTSEAIDHFFIAGGRNVMWSIGMELIERYPIGIGLDNSAVLQDYAREIPDEHEHFHSNYLNIAVELGLVGLSIFIYWLFRLLLTTNKTKNLALFCAIIAWLIAGLVEYNFGDSEVFIILILICALIDYLAGPTAAKLELNAA